MITTALLDGGVFMIGKLKRKNIQFLKQNLFQLNQIELIPISGPSA